MRLWKFVLCIAAPAISLLAIYFACVFFSQQLIVLALFVVFLALSATSY